MTLDAARLGSARKVADAILYEGYLLYPYRQSAQKNRSRFQFGVLMPPAYSTVDESELAVSQTECLLECSGDAQVVVTVRFLQLQRRQALRATLGAGKGAETEVDALIVDGTEHTTWDEALEREHQVVAEVSELLSGDLGLALHAEAGQVSTDLTDGAGNLAGRLVRSWNCLDGVIRLRAQRVAGPFGALRLTLRVENLTAPGTRLRSREDGLAHALIAAHALIWVPGGSFISMTDSPEWAAAEVAACENIGTWPVLAGPEGCQDMMLSAPVILYDHAEVAPESPGDMFDATEIDEILTLRTLALTDAEKLAARATDPRAAALLDRLDEMPPEIFDRLHGAIRYLRSATGGRAAHWDQDIPGQPNLPWWDPGSDSSVSPETDQVIVDGVPVMRGSLVLLRPGTRRADAQDLFLAGREAIVQAVLHDVDGNVHVAVTPQGDPAADLHASHGRFLYFATDEIEPVRSEPARSEPARSEEEPA